MTNGLRGVSMYFDNRKVTLDSYLDIFKDFSLDIQDEVRSMILDNIDLTEFIYPCKDNPYRLNQIRLAYKEGISSEYFRIDSGKILYKIRQFISETEDSSILLPYITRGFSDSEWDYIIEWATKGYLDSRLNLHITPFSMWSSLDVGLKLGLPMWIFTNGKSYSNKFIESMIKILSNGYSVKRYLTGDWSISVIEKIAAYSYRRWFSRIEPFLYDMISYNFIFLVGELISKHAPVEKYMQLAKDDATGELYYLYTSYHLEFLLEAYEKGYDVTDLEDYSLSENEMRYRLSKKNIKTKGVFQGKL